MNKGNNMNFVNSSLEGCTQNSSIQSLCLPAGISLMKIENTEAKPLCIKGELATDKVQIYLSKRGVEKLSFYEAKYVKEIKKDQSLLCFNPDKSLPYVLTVSPQGKLIILSIPILKLHEWLCAESQELYFQKKDHCAKKYYAQKELNLDLKWVLGQLFNLDFQQKGQKLYCQAKIMELISLYFSNKEENKHGKCPFLQSDINAQKIRHAKEIILAQYDKPALLEELAKEVGLNTSQLKSGFKRMYGNSIHKYLIAYRLTQAQYILQMGLHRVNEVGFQVGYENTSYFIAAFKKEFGLTPKKYVQQLQVRQE